MKALKVCLGRDKVSTHYLQRVMMLSYYQALPVYKELKAKGIIIREEISKSPFGWTKVGVVDQTKLRQCFYN